MGIYNIGSNKYHQIFASNNPAVDVVVPRMKTAFQMTVSRNHPVKAARFSDLVNTLIPYPSSSARVKLYFEVPPDEFPLFKPHGTKKNVLEQLPPILAHVDQYVLEKPFSFQLYVTFCVLSSNLLGF